MKPVRPWLVAIALAAAMPAQAAADTDAEAAALLERAQYWQARQRDDLAREALDRLQRFSPDYPDGLAFEVRLLARAGQDTAAAKVLERLRRLRPDHPEVASLGALLRVRGPDKERLRQVRQLAKAGRLEQAASAYRELFPDAFPDEDHALEYAELRAATPGGWEPAREILADIARRHPQNLRYRLALAGHLSLRKPVDAGAFRTLRELAADPEHSKEARQAWRRAVMRLDAVEQNLPLLREYVAAEPGDSAVRERYDDLSRAVEARRRLLADPSYQAKQQGLALLEAGKPGEAESKLRTALAGRPRDAELAGALGLALLRQGNHDEAIGYFEQAREEDRAARAKWEGLLRTTRYWSLVKRAAVSKGRGDLDLSESQLREARGFDPREAYAAAELARLRAARGDAAEAERLFREALAAEPGYAPAIEGLIGLELAAGRDEAARRLADALTPAQRAEIGASVDAMFAARLRAQARAMRAAGRDDDARKALESAARLDPSDPWLRLDLARLLAARGEAARGQALFDALLERRPGDADARFALALYLSGVDRDPDALRILEGVAVADRSAGMTRLQRRLWVSVQGRLAAAEAARGEKAAASGRLAAAQEAIGEDADLALEVASDWLQVGNEAAAQVLLARFAASPGAQSIDWRLGEARLLERLGAFGAVRVALSRIESVGSLTAEQRETIEALKVSAAIREAESLLEAGRPLEAIGALEGVRPARSSPAQGARASGVRADALRAARRLDEADAAYGEVLAVEPDNIGALLARSELAGERGDEAGARRFVETALRAGPGDSRALAAAARIATEEGRIEEAIAFRQRALAAAIAGEAGTGLSRLRLPGRDGDALAIEPAPTPPPASPYGYRPLADLLDQETPWFAGAIDWRYRSGTAGKSRVGTQELPLEWRQGSVAGGRWTLRADLASVDAGRLDLAGDEAGTYGSVLLCQPGCATGTLAQRERGVAPAVVYEQGPWRVDAGATPLGFPVTNLVGGASYRGDLGAATWTAEVSRRAINSSVLSYAGAHDPGTGRTWGGVVASGLRLSLSRDTGGDYGAWSSAGAHRLTGRSVKDNDRLQLMGGVYRRLINENDRQLAVGVTAMHWRFSENAGEYTFGHGGYYSPRTYSSLSLPVTFAWRDALDAFALRVAVSVSWAQSRRAPFFPTDSALQARAEELAALNFVDPFYAGGSGGRSFGRAFSASWERQVLPALFVGALLELERSPDYTPNRFLLYLRLATDHPAARPVALPPQPVLPRSQN